MNLNLAQVWSDAKDYLPVIHNAKRSMTVVKD